MTTSITIILLIWTCVFVYGMFACVDLGASIWYAWAYFRKRRDALYLIHGQLSSFTWTIIHVFLIVIVVAMVSFFPPTAMFVATNLLGPAAAALFLMVLRGGFLALQAGRFRPSTVAAILHGGSGILLPLLLVTILPLSEGGSVHPVNGLLYVQPWSFLKSPLLWAFAALSVGSVLYLSAIQLAARAQKAGALAVEREFTRAAARIFSLTWVAALATFACLDAFAPLHFSRLLQTWPALVSATLLFPIVIWLLVRQHSRLAQLCAVTQYILAASAYSLTHLPYLVYPYLTVDNAYTATLDLTDSVFDVIQTAIIFLIPAVWIGYQTHKHLRRKLEQPLEAAPDSNPKSKIG
ncbi:MAG: cytochrome d ubiquinol oxidase subunit II [Alicyclobacillus herbarius]|uniref:cytochrome d ubiquinol oxidase subunit II n=1 Tax=Alicyclobacillus herbarius TaxID=122960 RepID=UPI002352BB7F|nr:cytochrome d ubiquinol oxidase subunit II [Alicyclobacillus herbarius]MCL6632670.1 cytochrome d ubiquinol oxidase subunit II [Alicyclobacillus herbarius]